MGRSARLKSAANIYHVMLRGINRQQIFYDDGDYRQFIKTVYRFQEKSGYTIHAYCIMGNHVHLLIQAEKESIGECLRRIEDSFAYYYNLKYHRSGHLFENRFRSEPVESDSYFLTVFRYIIQNPLKAGLCRTIYEYPWSSIFFLRKTCNNTVIRNYFSSQQELFEYLEKSNEDKCLDWDFTSDRIRFSDDEVNRVFCDLSGCRSIIEFKLLSYEEQVEIIKRVLGINNNLSQIARITGFSRYKIEKIKNKTA